MASLAPSSLAEIARIELLAEQLCRVKILHDTSALHDLSETLGRIASHVAQGLDHSLTRGLNHLEENLVRVVCPWAHVRWHPLVAVLVVKEPIAWSEGEGFVLRRFPHGTAEVLEELGARVADCGVLGELSAVSWRSHTQISGPH